MMNEQEEPKTGLGETVESGPDFEVAHLGGASPEATDADDAEAAPEILETAGQAVPEPEMGAEWEQAPGGLKVEAEPVEPEPVEAIELQGAESEPAAAVPEGMAVPEPEPKKVEVDKGTPPGREPPLVEMVPAPIGWGRFLFVGLLSAILGALLALAFLFAVNGTLDFQGAAARKVDTQVAQLQGQIDGLSARLDQTQSQVAALQSLSAEIEQARADIQRVSADIAATQKQAQVMAGTLETTQQGLTNLTENVDGLAGQVGTLTDRLVQVEKQAATLDEALQAMRETTRRFEAFLDGLRALLQDSSSPLQPTAAPGIAPISSATPIPRPKVTVIPLVTPTPTP
jgi:hypothetical protein